MPRVQEPEWTRFRVGVPRDEPEWATDCLPLNTVTHVAHLDVAKRILEDGKIKAGLVFDRSKLNTERVLVTWLSPNDWSGAGGFRYGNIRFKFAWERLIQNKRYYWVESIAYGISACRILITSNDLSNRLDEYDPTLQDGPWWHDTANNRHYWNSRYCLEVMLEDDLSIRQSDGVDFVDHHPRYCSVNRDDCSSLGLRRDTASARFLAAVVANEYDPAVLKLTAINNGILGPNNVLRLAWQWLAMNLSSVQVRYHGGINRRHRVAPSLVRALLGAYANSHQNDLTHVAGLFESKVVMLECCQEAIAAHFQITDRRVLRMYD